MLFGYGSCYAVFAIVCLLFVLCTASLVRLFTWVCLLQTGGRLVMLLCNSVALFMTFFDLCCDFGLRWRTG